MIIEAAMTLGGKQVERVAFPFKPGFKGAVSGRWWGRGFTWRAYYGKKTWAESVERFETREAAMLDWAGAQD